MKVMCLAVVVFFLAIVLVARPHFALVLGLLVVFFSWICHNDALVLELVVFLIRGFATISPLCWGWCRF